MTTREDILSLAAWKLVPIEPTEAMLANTVDAKGTIRVLDFTTPEERGQAFLIPRYAYRAMLAAAPEPPEPSALETTPAMRERLAELSKVDGHDDYDRVVLMLLRDFARLAAAPTPPAAEAPDLPWRRRDIERGLILFRTSSNAHGSTNVSILSEKVDALPQSAKDELAGMMRNIAIGLSAPAPTPPAAEAPGQEPAFQCRRGDAKLLVLLSGR